MSFFTVQEWVELLKRIQDRGKGLFVGCEANKVVPIMEVLRPEGVIIYCGAASAEEAKELVRNVEKVCAKR